MSPLRRQVLGTAGDTHLGGNDFDDRIVDWLVGTFEQREGIDLRQDAQALQRLIEAAERAKMELSSLSATRISVPFVSMGADGPKHIEETLTRDHFEDLCRDLVDRIRTPVQTLLAEQGFRAKDLAEVVFVGGSSRMPMFHDVARELTGFKPVNKSVNVEEVVAVGAAVQASMLIGETRDIMLFDVTPLTLGDVSSPSVVVMPLINRNQTLPHKKVMMFTTSENAQDEIEVIVLQGERPMAKDNKRLGSFVLDNIPPAPIGVPKIEVSFEIGLDGILEEPQLQHLGSPVGFAGKNGQPAESLGSPAALASLGLQAPLFFKPTDHTFLFTKGGQCPGGVSRAVAVHFTCGLEARVLKVTEVQMCAYVALISHPGPCSLESWPPALGSLASKGMELPQLEAAISEWLRGSAANLTVREGGPLDWDE
ncbi:unnamed protein product, partial [Prorocentrum cordatum]